MGKETKNRRSRAPATTPEAREAQLINLAMSQAEKQLEKGTASSQVITHFLKLGTEKARLERAKIEAEVALANAKVEAIKSQQTSEELYQEAIKAFTSYQPGGFYEDDWEEDNYEYN